MRRSQGFTLIEVMITVAIIAILSAIALPAYTQYVTRSRITEAIAGLTGMRVKMEQYFQDNRKYDGACATGTVATPPPGNYFTFTCPTATGNLYTLQALGTGPMNGFTYKLDQSNNQTTTALPAGWSGTSNSCWVLKKDGSC